MAFFRKQTRQSDANVYPDAPVYATEPTVDSACAHPYGNCHDGCVLQTVSIEAGDDVTERSVDALEALDESSAAWLGQLYGMRNYLEGVRDGCNDAFKMHSMTTTDSREGRRAQQNNSRLQRQKADLVTNTILVHLRDPAVIAVYDRYDNKVKSSARELLMTNRYDAIARTQNGSKEAPLRIAEQPVTFTVIDEREITTPNKFVALYNAELSSRVELSRLLFGNPALGQQLLSPRTLEVLPEGIRTLIANEFQRPADDSIVHSFLQKHPLNDDTLTFSEYVRHNHHSENVRTSLATLATGACVAGAPSCPANKYGLCEGILRAVPEEQLTTNVRADLEKARIESSRTAMNDLKTAIARYSTHEMFNSGILIELAGLPSEQSPQSSSKRSAKRTTPLKHQSPSVKHTTQPEFVQEHRPVTIGFANSDESIDLKDIHDPMLLEQAISEVIASSVYKKYIETHIQSKEKLEVFFTAALQEIIGNTRFTAQSNGIRKLTDMHPFVVGEHKYPWYRLSGRSFRHSTVTNDPIVDATRMYFAAGSGRDPGSRVVYLYSPAIKQSVDNASGHFLPSS